MDAIQPFTNMAKSTIKDANHQDMPISQWVKAPSVAAAARQPRK